MCLGRETEELPSSRALERVPSSLYSTYMLSPRSRSPLASAFGFVSKKLDVTFANMLFGAKLGALSNLGILLTTVTLAAACLGGFGALSNLGILLTTVTLAAACLGALSCLGMRVTGALSRLGILLTLRRAALSRLGILSIVVGTLSVCWGREGASSGKEKLVAITTVQCKKMRRGRAAKMKIPPSVWRPASAWGITKSRHSSRRFRRGGSSALPLSLSRRPVRPKRRGGA